MARQYQPIADPFCVLRSSFVLLLAALALGGRLVVDASAAGSAGFEASGSGGTFRMGDGSKEDGLAARKRPDPGGLELSLRQVVQLALRQSVPLLKGQRARDLRATELLQAYAQFLPSVSAQASYGYLNGTNYATLTTPARVNSVHNLSAYSLSSSLNLFNGFADFSSFKAALALQEGARLSLLRAKQLIVLDISQNFWQAVLDNEWITIAQKQLRLLQEKNALERGPKRQRRLDRFGAKWLEQQQEANALLEQAQKKWTTDVQLLNRKLHLGFHEIARLQPVAWGVLEEVAVQQASVPAAAGGVERGGFTTPFGASLNKRPDLQSLEQNWQASQWNLQAAQASYLPKLDLGFTFGGVGKRLQIQNIAGVSLVPNNQTDLWTQLGIQASYTVALTLSVNVFDRWLTQTAVERAQVSADQLRLDLEEQKRQVEWEVYQAAEGYQAALNQWQAIQQKVLRMQKNQQKSYPGTMISPPLSSSSAQSSSQSAGLQWTLALAQGELQQALIALELERLTLAFAQGTLDVEELMGLEEG